MKKLLLLLSLLTTFSGLFWFLGNSFEKASANNFETSKSSKIKEILKDKHYRGLIYTEDTIWQTFDNGETWQELMSADSSQKISEVFCFFSVNECLAVLANSSNTALELLKINLQNRDFEKTKLDLPIEDLVEADLANISLDFTNSQNGKLKLRQVSSSNFNREVIYATADGGKSWFLEARLMDIKTAEKESLLSRKIEGIELPKDENILQISSLNDSSVWILTSRGTCEGFKSGCLQETKLYRVFIKEVEEITPTAIKELAEREKQAAKTNLLSEEIKDNFSPGGSTRISVRRGFDKCTAATSAQMQTWWNTSPFYDVNIYVGGNNRGCSQPQLTQAWVNAVSAQGWGLIPTWVGPQAPCTTCTRCSPHSSDVLTAELEGRNQADLAITAVNGLGLTQGTIIYYDMERYADNGCGAAVNSFLKGWTDRLKEQGYKSGTYGSPTNANIDWRNIPLPSRMDAVWLARWDNNPSVWVTAPANLPNTEWANYQRIKQYIGPRDETWGGITFNIDNNQSEAPVVGLAIPKNKVADFDGDGKTDVSLYRPETTGVWYVLTSSNGGFNGNAFGTIGDILTPGDFDGDGKTDYAVFRPSESTWYLQTKSGGLRSQTFGTATDIPAPADYNGDGITDLAVFRPSTGDWYIWRSSGSPNPLQVFQFGQNGDKPVPADYDGDGKTDIAVWRASTGAWYVLKSSDGNSYGVLFGISTDKPAQGDYDGDGKADFAVLRDGVWYLLRSQLGFTAIQFGIKGDIPVTGDYDGDNKADIAVWRPATGVWYLLQSQNGFGGVQFGTSTDKPIPNVYLP